MKGFIKIELFITIVTSHSLRAIHWLIILVEVVCNYIYVCSFYIFFQANKDLNGNFWEILDR